jgi:hypothetical protein
MPPWISFVQSIRSFASPLRDDEKGDCLIVAATRSMPAAAQPFPAAPRRQHATLACHQRETRRTGRPVPFVGGRAHEDVLPQTVGRLVPEVVPVQLDLGVGLLDHRLVLRDHTVVRERRRDHVDKVAPDTRQNAFPQSALLHINVCTHTGCASNL